MNNRVSSIICSASVVSAAACIHMTNTSAWGGVVSATGNVTHVPTPSGNINGLDILPHRVWNERTSVPVTSLAVQVLNNPASNDGSHPAFIPGFYSGTVDSHLVYGSDLVFVNSTITFTDPIVAVMFVDNLDQDLGWVSNAIFAFPNQTIYGGVTWDDGAVISVVGNQLTLSNVNGHPTGFDCLQMRVLTAVPSPTSAAAGVLAILGLASRRRR